MTPAKPSKNYTIMFWICLTLTAVNVVLTMVAPTPELEADALLRSLGMAFLTGFAYLMCPAEEP